MRQAALLRRIRLATAIFMLGLVISGITAIPLGAEVDLLAKFTGAEALVGNSGSSAPDWALWLVKVRHALGDTGANHPLMFYGTDWLAFGHFMIALVFVGALRDPVRNAWLFTFGIIACALVAPYALCFGAARGIPFWWRLIDCSFGVFGIVPVWLCRRWTTELGGLSAKQPC